MTVDARVLRALTRMFSSGWFWAALIVLTLALVFLLEVLNPIPMDFVNDGLWIVTNLILFAGYIALAFYVVVYGLIFEWRWLPERDPLTGRRVPNIGGRRIFQLTASETGLVVLIVTQLFFFPTSGRVWYIAPEDPVVWLPTVRFLVYGAVVVAVFQLAAQLVKNIVNAEPVQILVTPRAERVAPSTEPQPVADAPGRASTTSAPPAGD